MLPFPGFSEAWVRFSPNTKPRPEAAELPPFGGFAGFIKPPSNLVVSVA